MTDKSKIANVLAQMLGDKLVSSETKDLNRYAIDGIQPKAVVFPKNTRQVSDIITYANEKNLAVVPQGSGSKVAMGHPPKRLDLVVCMSRMNHMKDVDVANLTLTVEAGVRFLDIQARLATEEDRCYLPLENLISESDELICSDRSHSGCFLPIDAPYSCSATIGGIIASNSSGPRRLLYNLPRDVILGSRFVAANGDIIGTGGKTVKNVSGYDISKLMVGSAGSLGILCEMTLRLLPLPEQMETMLFSFNSFNDASAFANNLLASSLLPAAVEVLNEKAFLSLEAETGSGFKEGAYVCAVALEAFPEAVLRMRSELREMAREANGTGEDCLEEEKHGSFWLSVSDLVPSITKENDGLISTQLNYPLSEWKDIIEFANERLSQNRLNHTLVAHAGSGVCLINILSNGNDTKKSAVAAVQELLDKCRQTGGNLVVQRAPSEIKKELPIWGKPGSDIILMKRIKEALDPNGIMSPGRFIDSI